MLLSKLNPPTRARRQRTNFSDEAIQSLEESFNINPYPDINEREHLAQMLNSSEDRIQVWFQNKRARFRKRMQKENKSGLKSEKKSISTKQPLTVLKDTVAVNSPIRNDSKQEYNLYSTPISTNDKLTYKFNQTSNSAYNHSLYDSGYFSMGSPSGFSFQSTPSTYRTGMDFVLSNTPTFPVNVTRVPKSLFRPF